MVRYFGVTVSVGIAITLAAMTGCSKTPSNSPAEAAAQPQRNDNATVASGSTDVSAAMDTVSHFLDAVRRGGDTGRAHSLLTTEACAVLERLGRTVQPIGSPDATFTVTRSEAVPEHPNMALVHSTWSEPTGEGTNESYQVVWAVQLEQGQWRISGLAMELDPSQPPMIVDFEDHVEMANLFRSETDAASASSVSSASSEPAGAVSQTPQQPTKF